MVGKEDDKTEKKPAGPGGVKHDARGNAVWEWAAESGRHAIASTSRLLKRLEVPGLKLEDDPGVLKEKTEAQEPGDPAGPIRTVGYDPYGGASTARGAGKVPKVAARPAPPVKSAQPAKSAQPMKPARPATKPATAKPSAPSLLRRLFRRD
jgi:hypothetical protein